MLNEEKHFDSEKLIDEVLKTPSNFSLSSNFADVLANKVEKKFAWEQCFKEFIIYLSVIVGLAISSAAMAFIWYEADWKEWLNFLLTNMSLVVGINILVVFILFADRVLLRYFMFKSSPEKAV